MSDQPETPIDHTPDPIVTAEMFALEVDERDRQGERALRSQQASQAHSRTLAIVWAPAVTLMLLGFFGMLALICYQITTEHADEHRHQISVWCYADPNTQDATSQATGSPADLTNFCPDHR